MVGVTLSGLKARSIMQSSRTALSGNHPPPRHRSGNLASAAI
jgi:hypothetical protein